MVSPLPLNISAVEVAVRSPIACYSVILQLIDRAVDPAFVGEAGVGWVVVFLVEAFTPP